MITTFRSGFGWAAKLTVLLLAFQTFAAQDTRSSINNVPPVLVEVGPHSRMWQHVDARGKPAGKPTVELATGMNYWDGTQWAASEPSFEEGDIWFNADKVLAKTRLARNLNALGSVEVTTPEGYLLRSTPLAIGLYNMETGDSAIIGTIKDCQGVLVSSNQVVYEDAFKGVSANIFYGLERHSFSQDVVITGRLNVEDFGFPTNNTQIQIITEFYECPQPDTIKRPIRVETNVQKRNRMATPDFTDLALGFGEFVLGAGRAYTMNESNIVSDGVVVGKSFEEIENRKFLVESIDVPTIQNELLSLPAVQEVEHAAIKKSKTKKVYAGIQKPAQSAGTHASVSGVKRVAKVVSRPSGVCIDYVATLGGTLYDVRVFSGDTNYFVSATCVCNGSVTLEGGAIFKYNPGASLRVGGSLACTSSQFSPVVFTAVDDNSIGECMVNITGHVVNSDPPSGYANPALELNNVIPPQLSNLIFRYCKKAVNVVGLINTAQTVLTLSDSQIIGCVLGITITGVNCGCGTCGYCGTALNVNNTLFDTVATPVTWAGPSCLQLGKFVHCTFANSQAIASGGLPSMYFTNSIFSSVTALSAGHSCESSFAGDHNGFSLSDSAKFGANRIDSGCPFVQPASGTYSNGKFYLDPVNGVNFLAAGTTAWVPSSVLLSFRNRTTSRGWENISGTIGDKTLKPKVPRYLNGNPNLGYYYPTVDYTLSGVTVSALSTLSVEPGTSIAFADSDSGSKTVGITLPDNATFRAQGAPNAFINLAKASWILEPTSSITVGMPEPSRYVVALAAACAGSAAPTIDLRFVRSSLASDDYHIAGGINLTAQTGGSAPGWDTDYSQTFKGVAVNLTVRDCAFKGGRIGLGASGDNYLGNVAGFANVQCSQFERVYFYFNPTSASLAPFPITAYNNLFRYGILRLQPNSDGNWVFGENLFDQSVFAISATPTMAWSANAYWPGSPLVGTTNAAMATDSGWLTAWQGYVPSATAIPSFSEIVDGVNTRVTLGQAPAYGSGPLGNYYIGQTSSTYTALKAKGRPLALSGLYHYTERYDLKKEGVDKGISGNGDIGLHYVCTDVASFPIDTDADGMPDYVEDANGNGLFDAGETDWQRPLASKTDMIFYTPLLP